MPLPVRNVYMFIFTWRSLEYRQISSAVNVEYFDESQTEIATNNKNDGGSDNDTLKAHEFFSGRQGGKYKIYDV